MEEPGADAGEAGVGRGDGDGAVGGIAPGLDDAAGAEADAEVRTGGDGDETGVGRGHVQLAVGVVAPGDDGAVGLEAQ